MSRNFCCFVLICVALGWCNRAEAQVAKLKQLPVPDAAAIEAANQSVNKLFQEAWDAAKTGDRKSKVYHQLCEALTLPIDDPATQYAMQLKRLSFAEQLNQWYFIYNAMRDLERDFDAVQMPVRMDLVRMLKKSATAYSEKDFCELLHETATIAIENDQIEMAQEVVNVGLGPLKRFKITSFDQSMSRLAKWVKDCEQGLVSVSAEIETLKRDPDDSKAALGVGIYRCATQLNWNTGLPLLAKGSDSQLATIAKQDLAERSFEGAESDLADYRRSVADAWFNYSRSAEGTLREISVQRALYWYLNGILPGQEWSKETLEHIEQLETEIPADAAPWGAVVLMTFDRSGWKNSPSGAAVLDVSGHKVGGDVKPGCKIADGKVGQGIALERIGAHVVFKSYPNVTDRPLSLGCWFKTRQWPDNEQKAVYLFGDINSDMRLGYALEVSRESGGFRLGNGNQWIVSRTPYKEYLEVDHWYHLAATFDGTRIKLYLNGKLETETEYSGTVTSSLTSGQIGHSAPDPGEGFVGTIDELAIFARALTAVEVNSLYRLGKQHNSVANNP